MAAILLGNGISALAHGLLSARAPSAGVPQMVLGRLAFGYRGNAVPSALMTITSEFGWFAVNSVSAAFALNSLTGMPAAACLVVIVLVQIGVAFVGHNLVQAFERFAFPVLAVVFAIGAVIVLVRSDPAAVPDGGGTGGIGGFLLTVGAVVGYTAGWSPYAADYARYLPADSSRLRTGLAAGLGLFGSTSVLMVVGAASVSATAAAGVVSDNPATAFVGVLPGALASLTLLAIALGAVAANVLNVYSGAMAFLSAGVDVPLRWARAVVALAFGVVGFVVLTDQYLRRDRLSADLLYDRAYRNHAGLVALLAGIAVSVPLFSNQVLFTGLVPRLVPGVRDVTFLVGFALSAALYALLVRRHAGVAARVAGPAE